MARFAISGQIAGTIRSRIEGGGERLWRLQDFGDLSFTATAQALSRLAKTGAIERLSKGIYYRARDTAFGPSRPNPAAIQNLAAKRNTFFPAGLAAANLLGFTTQTARRTELATTASSLPRKLFGDDIRIHTRRPAAWSQLPAADAALLDFLRRGARTSELSPEDTIRRTLTLLSEPGRYERLIKTANTEPPRIRAMLGALGEQLGRDAVALGRLRTSLNPLSRYDFGIFSRLPNAQSWQAKAKEKAPREAL